MIIDCRVNPPYGGWLSTYFFRPRPLIEDPVRGNAFAFGRQTPRSFLERSMGLFVEEMDEAGIDVAVLSGQQAAARFGSVPNEDVAGLARRYPKRFVPLAGIDASSADAVREVERAVGELGCRGIQMQPGWGDPPLLDDDERIYPIYEACQRLEMPVMITSSQYIGADQTWSMPHHLQRVARAFPALTLIISHGCWPWTTQACGLAMMCPNVYLMPDFYMHMPDMPGAMDYVNAANSWLSERVLYSSCYPTRSLGQALADFRALPLRPAVQEKLLWRNAARLLGLQASPPE